MLFQAIFTCLVTFGLSSSTEPPKQCLTNIPKTNNLDLEKWSGKWYVVASSQLMPWLNCTVIHIQVHPETLMAEDNYNERGEKISKDFYFDIDVETAHLTFPFLRLNDVPHNEYIYSDYDTMGFSYGCKELPDGSLKEFSWMVARDLADKTEIYEKVKNIFKEKGSDLANREFHIINQENCPPRNEFV